jgi:hypothetical protein
MSASSSNTASGGFGITLHHEGQNADNSLSPSPSGGTGDHNKQEARNANDHHGTINEDDIKNNKP